MALREYLSATLSTSSTATIVTLYKVAMNTLRNWLECPITELKLIHLALTIQVNIIYTYNSVE